MLIPVDDPRDARVAAFARNERGLASRADRRDDRGAGLFLAEGDLVVDRALAAGCVPVAALVDRAAVTLEAPGGRSETVSAVVETLRTRVDVLVGGPALRTMVAGLGTVHPVIALFRRPPRPSAAELVAASRRLVVVEQVDNPANVGAIVRNAAGLGWDGVLLDNASADPLSRRALRVAVGTAFALPHARTHDLVAALAAAHDLATVALTPATDATDLDALAGQLAADDGGGRPRALLVGSERDGLSAGLSGRADHRARIPMARGVDSLNVAAATAVACYALR